MEHWRQIRYSGVSKALKRIERRSDKLQRRINGSPAGQVPAGQLQRGAWTDEVAKLQEMSEHLLDFRDRLYFYSNGDYVEALNEWETEIEKICIKAEGFTRPPFGQKYRRRVTNY